MLKARTQRIAGAPRWTPSPAMIVSLLALFVALGGSAYAAFSLPPNTVGTIQLKNGAVSGAKLKNDAVTSSKIKNGTLLAKDFKLGQLPSDDAFIAASGTGSITRDVAPGLYLVTGEANYVSHIATDFIAQCTLTSPSPVSYHVDRSTLHAGDSLTIPIHGSVRFAEAGTITVTCPTVAGIDAAPYIALIKVASLSEPSG